MSKIQEKVAEFFASHPDINEVYEALGVLFTEKEKAQKYLAGVAGRMVTAHGREGLNFERESDRIRHEIIIQENLVGQKHIDYEATPIAEKQQAMSAWEKETRKLEELKARLVKQENLEAKEELIEKNKKAENPKVAENNPRTKEQLLSDISAQQVIVDTNEKMIAKMTDAKKKKAEKAQKDEVKLLDQLKEEFAKRFPAEENSGGGAEEDAGDGAEVEN